MSSTSLRWSPGLLCRWLMGLILLGGLLWAVDIWVGWGNLPHYWQRLPADQLLLACSLFVGSHLLRARRIQCQLSYQAAGARSGTSPAPFLLVARLSAQHQLANNLLPMRVGELAFPLLLRRYTGASWGQGLSSLLWLRLLDFVVMGAVVAGLLLGSLNRILSTLPWSMWLAGLALVLLLALALWFRRDWLARELLRWRWLQPLRDSAPRSWRQLLTLLWLTLAAWLLKLSALAWVIASLLGQGLATALGGALGAELSSILPIHGFAGAGSFEAAFFAGASLSGAASLPDSPLYSTGSFSATASADLLATAVNLHLFVLSCTALVALIFTLLPLPSTLRVTPDACRQSH